MGRLSVRYSGLILLLVASILVGTVALSEAPASALTPGGTFEDDNGNVHEGYIEAIFAAGLTNGCVVDGSEYCPSGAVTRAEMATFIVRALGASTDTNHQGHFPDVDGAAWYAPYVERLFESGITTGYEDGTFRPSSTVTRAEMAALLVRAFDHLSPVGGSASFSDVPADAWYAEYVEGLLTSAVTKGCAASPLSFCPSSPVLRDQMATFLGRSLGLEQIIPPPATNAGSTHMHVDVGHPDASDSNSGSVDQPLRTIQEAIDRSKLVRQDGQPVTVTVHPGVYREALQIGYAGSNPPPLVVEAVSPRTAVVSGSDIWTGWSYDSATGSQVHSWPHDWGQASGVDPIVGRREMVFVDGRRLDQVLSSSELRQDSFYVDEGANRIHVRTAGSMSSAEVAVRARTLTMDGATNVTIRGLVFRHAASPFESSSVEIVNGGNHILDQNEISQNNWVGLGVTTLSNVTLSGNTIDHNGGGGIGVYQAPGLVMQSNSTSYNNWRGVRGDFTGWSIGAVKMVGQHDTTIQNHTSVGNSTRGFWIDYDISNVTIRDSDFSGNLTDGLFVEAAQGPVTITNTEMSGNGRYGLLVVNTDSTTVSSSRMCGNAKSALRIDSEPGGRTVETGSGSILIPAARNLTLSGNTLGASERLMDANIPSEQWSTFTSTLTSGGNVWTPIDPSNAFVFQGQKTNLAGWQSATGQDADSVTAGSGC